MGAPGATLKHWVQPTRTRLDLTSTHLDPDLPDMYMYVQHRITRLVSICRSMSVTDRYTQSQTRLHKPVATELDTATEKWRRNAANAHLAAHAGVCRRVRRVRGRIGIAHLKSPIPAA